MDDRPAHHRTLERQLHRLGLSPTAPPDPGDWAKMLHEVSKSYRETEADRYTMERSIEVSSDEMQALHDVLSRQARHDTLTGLPNRAALGEFLQDTLRRLRPVGNELAVLFLDLDGFKLVNDSLGHSTGDELLVLAAERIKASTRDRDMVFRLGGDEFVVACGDIEGIDAAVSIATRIACQFERPFRIGSQSLVISASIGIALARAEDITADDLLRKADMAMYEAKAGGRCQFVIFDDDMSRRVDGRLATITALRNAVDADEFVLHYQPIVRLADLHLLGVEALVRWNRPGHGLLSPDVFIPIAEENRLITAIDSWVIRRACEEVTSWDHGDAALAVNLSAHDLQHPHIVDVVRGALWDTGLPAGRFVIELTESTLVKATASIATNLSRLKSLGVRLAIDDFGTGYSSLSYLRQIPAQTLKIDRSFVSALNEDDAAAAIVDAIVHMGHALGMTIVAEGVERPGQAERLRAVGCDAAQGYLFARPQPMAELNAMDGRNATPANRGT